MEKLKIGLFIDTFYPMIDGVIMVVDNYAKRLNKIADIVVFCPKPIQKKYECNLDYPIVRSKRLTFYSYDYCLGTPKFDKNFKRKLNEFKPDIVHIHSPFSIGKYGLKYAKKHNIPCIATLHSQFKQDFYKATKMKWLTNILMRTIMKVFNGCDECWAVNEDIKKLYQTEYKLKAPCSVQQNGTDLLPIENTDKAYEEVNDLYNIDKDANVFCFVGRLTVLKNILFIADALNELKKQNIKFKMIYVGSGFDEKLLKDKIKKLHLENEVVLAGKIADKNLLSKIFARSKLLLFPSKYDTDGIVKYEAACQHTPTLTLKGLPCACNIKDNINGYLSDDDIKLFAEKIIEICNNEEQYKQVQENAFKDLYITWDKVVDNAYERYIQKIKDFKK